MNIIVMVMAMTGFKFRAHPTREQKLQFARWSGCARMVYNLKCAELKSGLASNQSYSHLKTDARDWLRDCPPEILRNSAANWYTAVERARQGLAAKPRQKKKSNYTSITITRELFRIEQANGKATLYVGNRKFPFGQVRVEFNKEFNPPNQIVLSRLNGHYYVSFSVEDGKPQLTETQVRTSLARLTPSELEAQAIGLDRGVKQLVADSEGRFYNFTTEQEKKLAKLEKRNIADQKKLARQKRVTKAQAKQNKTEWQPSQRQAKTKRRIAEAHEKAANIRHDCAHQITAMLVMLPFLLYVIENLKIANMTRKPKAKQDENGKWLKNGARAKAGLNRSILASCMGKIALFLTYKTLRAGKLTIRVNPAHTSRECSQCGHTAKTNRPTQAKFKCESCGHVEHADRNAGKVIKRRGMRDFLASPFPAKPRKTITRRTRARAEGESVRQVVARVAACDSLGTQNLLVAPD
jgi:putative transposase